MKKNSGITILIFCIFVLQSCFSQQQMAYHSLQKKWMLVEMGNFSKEQLIKANAFIDLQQKDKKSFANMGCNSLIFSYKATSGKIKFSPVASTRKLCPQQMEIEQYFQNILPEVESYMIEGHFITLKTSKGEVIKAVAEDWD